jgi:sugar O-acyltransferase (sialic acid O-acetyltransferase NeuD family)
MTNRAFVGFGELGAQIASMVDQIAKPNHLVIFDDIAYQQRVPNSQPFDAYADEIYAAYDFYVCLGYKHLQRKLAILDQLGALGRSIPVHCAPSTFLNTAAILNPGVIVYPMSNIDKDVQVGCGSLLNNSVILSHNCRIGSCCYLSPGVTVSGYVSIGDCTFIGAGSIISNNVSIGRNVSVGIGTVVSTDLPDDVSAIGNPMRILTHKLRIV